MFQDDEFDFGDGGASPVLFDPIDEVDENMQPEVDLPSPTKEVEKRSRKSKQDVSVFYEIRFIFLIFSERSRR